MGKRDSLVRFGAELRRQRLKSGMTLEELARGADLTPNYIGTIEIGKRDPSLSTLFSLARGLKMHPAELLGTVRPVSRNSLETARLFDASPSELQEALLEVLRVCGVSKRR